MKLLFDDPQSHIKKFFRTGIQCCAKYPNTTAAIVTGTALLVGLMLGSKREAQSISHRNKPSGPA